MKVSSEETVEEFVAKLPKGNMFSRRSIGRISLLLPKVRVTEEETHARIVGEDAQSRNAQTNVLKDKIEAKKNTSGDGGNSTVKNSVQKSVLLKEFHELRKSRLSSGLLNPRLNIATPSQNNPISLSLKKRTPFNSGLRNLRSRGKSPALHQANNGSSPFVLPKRFNLRTCKKVSVHSSTKKGISHARNETSQIKAKKNVKENVDQNCCRSLMFSEDDADNEESEKENTKPLPSLELSSFKKSGSMLSRRSTISIRSQFEAKNNSVSVTGNRERVSDSNDDYNLTSESDVRQKAMSRGTIRRRYSNIHSMKNSQSINSKQRRRSEMPTSMIQAKNESVLSPITEKNNPEDSNFSSFTRQSSRKSRIPLLFNETISRSPNIAVISPAELVNQNLITDEKTQEKGFLSESCTIETNDINSKACAKCSSRITVKDSSTNTSDTNEVLQSNIKEIENEIKKIFSDQLRLENQFEVITQDFFREGKNIIQEYKSNFDSLNKIVSEFKHVLTLPSDSLLTEKEKVEQIKSKPVTYPASKNIKTEYKFLGTPIARKNRKLMHCFSDPSTPTEKSPDTKEASFHSVDSVISPFTNIVGDLERPSLLPMTPGSRHNFTCIKSCLNEQLDMLLK